MTAPARLADRHPRLLAIPGAMLVRAVWHNRGFVWGMVRREFHAR